MPGLIDAHVHFSGADAAKAFVARGITTVRALHVDHFVDVEVRELHRKGNPDVPDVLASGYMIRPDMNAWQTFFEDFPEFSDLTKRKAAGVDEVRRLVQANLRHGVNQIKILATERAGQVGHDPRRRTFTDAELSAIVGEARSAGISVAAHAHGEEGGAAAVRAGVSTIDHGWFLSDATIDLMKSRGTCLVPTIGVANVIEKTRPYREGTPEVREQIKAGLAAGHEMASRAYRKGVRIIAGTDTYNSLLPVSTEVAELVQIGMKPMEAIMAATSVAARCLNIDSRTGSVRPGLEADLLVVDGPPLTDIKGLANPVLVINDGQIAIRKIGTDTVP
jgi:imidazolonepropionase-like amidohydrolase